MPQKSRLNQKFAGKLYMGYDTPPVDHNGVVFCPRCADSKSQQLEVEVMQHSYMPNATRATFMVKCEKCGYDYAFQGTYDTTQQTMDWDNTGVQN